MAVRMHVHEGAKRPHPVNTSHRSEITRTAHEHELRVYGRNKIKAGWKKGYKSKKDLYKIKPADPPSTMNKSTHNHFRKIVDKLITSHQKKYNVPEGYVHQGFHKVNMPIAYRKLKETHFQDFPSNK